MRSGEYEMMVGLVCAALGAALFPYVFIGLIGALLLLAAFLILLTTVPRTEKEGWMPEKKSWVSEVGYFLSVCLLLYGALNGACAIATMTEHRRLGSEWYLAGTCTLMASILMESVLRSRTNWGDKRCLFWAVTTFCVMPLAVFVFWILSPFLPLTA
ncbi:MAG: hypothetical protein ACK5E3_01095 [Planctomycetota bacterium]|jgi:hypothetical protein